MESPLEVLSRAAEFIESDKSKDLVQGPLTKPSDSPLKLLPGRLSGRSSRHSEYERARSTRHKQHARSSPPVESSSSSDEGHRPPRSPPAAAEAAVTFEQYAAKAAAAMVAAQRILPPTSTPEMSGLALSEMTHLSVMARTLGYIPSLPLLPNMLPWTAPVLSPLAPSLGSQTSPNTIPSPSALLTPSPPSRVETEPTVRRPQPLSLLAGKPASPVALQEGEQSYNHKKFGSTRKDSPITTTEAANTDSIDEHFRRSLDKYPEAAKVLQKTSSQLLEACGSVDEHFAKSLGVNWQKLSQKQTSSSVASNTHSTDNVDDHFAKALGDTWLKLKEKQSTDIST